jgi:transcriptional regulator with XRE-family HTH domain
VRPARERNREARDPPALRERVLDGAREPYVRVGTADASMTAVMDRRRRDLADFLRSRRERLKPADVGLRSGMRRRTPGLRREEVAELAGIGAGWYTFLEQGRDVRPSEGALRRIAAALQLDPTEQRYLLRLALEPARTTHDPEVVPAEVAVVIRAIPAPALVLGRGWDILDYNEASNALLDLPYQSGRNLLRLVFSPELRLFYTNWEHRARQLVSSFRAQNAAFLRDPTVMTVVEDLEESCPQFRAWWTEQAVSEENSGHWTSDHPFVGRLELDYTMLGVLDSSGLLVDVCYWHGEESHRRLGELIRQVRDGERSREHNIWTALAAKVRREARGGRAAGV